MITAVVPVYNAKDTLRRCLDSVLAQGWKLVIVNDGSTDGSGAICDEYQNLATVIHTNNHGPAHARNVGLDVVTTDEVTFVDADDYISGLCYLVKPSLEGIHWSVKDYLRAPYRGPSIVLLHGKVYSAPKIRFDDTLRIFEDMDFTFRHLSVGGKIKFYSGYVHTKPNASMKAYPHQQKMILKALRSMQAYIHVKIDHAYTCLTIVHLVRSCRKLGMGTYRHVREVVREMEYDRMHQYRRAKRHSVLIPWLLWLRMPFLLMLACHWRARSRYG